jgi:penicillin-binding protein 1C
MPRDPRKLLHDMRPWRHKRVTLLLVAALAVAGATVVLWPMDTTPYLVVGHSPELVDRDGRLLFAFLNDHEQWCFQRDLAVISPKLLQATIAIEDQRFYTHHGVDPIAVVRAGLQNVAQARVASGASTLTMQLVKQVERHPRSLWGKAVQAVQAVRLDRRLPKDTILEAYLNTAPYGQNIVGCEAAARRYFGKPAAELTLSEAALLAGLPKAPSALMPLRHPERALARRNHVLRRMLLEGFISEAECREAVARPLGVAWHDYPALAPHLAMRLRNQIQDAPLETTLDFSIQQSAERILRQRIARYQGDVTNGAVMVVDVASGEVLARVGSADYFKTPGGGMFDACLAARSPGSALKPFTYALAMERQRLYPTEMLLDDSLDYGRYSPENYDRDYRGVTTAAEALQRSLNVPAVAVLERLGQEELRRMLDSMKLSTVDMPGDHYGLGLTLGNCEVRLEEMMAAYLTLASMGEYRQLRWRNHGRAGVPPAIERARVLSPEVCAAIFEMLEQPLPMEFEREAVKATGILPRVAWKTGTSTGHRDAWAFVFNRHYLVGVWLGNNNAAPSKRLVGADAALPLAGRLMRALPVKSTAAWPETATYMATVDTCAVSGVPASNWCSRTRSASLPRTQFLHRVCDMHYPGAGGEPLERWPGAARGWDLAKIDGSAARRTEQARSVEALRILQPVDQAEYVLTGEPNGDRIRLRASVDAHTPLHWYANDRYLGQSAAGEPLLYDLSAGEHRLTCLAPGGAYRSVAIRVHEADGGLLMQ